MASIDDEDIIEDECTCDKIEYEEHICPFQCEIHDDQEFKCNCCPYHTQQCADDI